MIRALRRYLGTDVPVLGVNFGRVGFLTSIPAAELDAGLERAFAGEFQVADLPTLDVRASTARRTWRSTTSSSTPRRSAAWSS